MKYCKFLFLLFLLAINFARADIGPKPTANIYVTYAGQPVQDPSFVAKMLSCYTPDYYGNDDPAVQFNHTMNQLEGKVNSGYLSELKQFDLKAAQFVIKDPRGIECTWIPAEFAWGGSCSNSGCDFGYYLPDQFRLAVYLPSQKRVFFTNAINRTDFNSRFEADLKPDGTGIIFRTEPNVIQKITDSSKFMTFFLSLVFTLVIEVVCALIYACIKKLDLKLAAYVAVANLISLPLFWYALPWSISNFLFLLAIGEVLVVILEALIVWKFAKGMLSFTHAIVLSLLLNALSFLFGILVPGLLLGGFF